MAPEPKRCRVCGLEAPRWPLYSCKRCHVGPLCADCLWEHGQERHGRQLAAYIGEPITDEEDK